MTSTNFFFHLCFVVTFLTFTAIRAYFQRKAQRTRGKFEYKEGKLHQGWRLVIGVPFILSLLLYLVQPARFGWAAFQLPGWARWTGVILGAATIPLILWIQAALGSNFSSTLHVRQEHTLVTHGPYQWVRHPMYSVLVLWMIANLLLTANGYIGGVPLVAFLVIVLTRLRNEEAIMMEKFGEEYRQYMQHTGRFLPKLKGMGTG